MLKLELAQNSLGEFVKPQSLIQEILGGAKGFASLTNPQVLRGLHFENHYSGFYNLSTLFTSTFIERIAKEIKYIKLLNINERGGNYEEIDSNSN